MSKVPEELLHYIWENRLFSHLTLNGDDILVLETGTPNHGDGPDFLLAKVKVGELTWVGAVELHVQASDWVLHQHSSDPNYDHIILHVVYHHDRDVLNSQGRTIPTATMEISEEVLQHLTKLQVANGTLRCMPEMMLVPTAELTSHFPTLLHQRFSRKLRELANRSQEGHLNTIFFTTMMRYLGAIKNNEQMELVAHSIPYTYLKKEAYNLTALEAILMGQAGLLQTNAPRDEYETKLANEYLFYREKFGLRNASYGEMRRLRVRPSSYPTRMLAIMAQLLQKEDELISAVARLDKKSIQQLLSSRPSPYWHTHFDFAHTSEKAMGGLGVQFQNILIINVVIPMAYHYATQRGDQATAHSALEWLTELPAEDNHIIRRFRSNHFPPQNAAESQSMMELHNEYCLKHRCLQCPMAPLILKHLRASSQG